MFYEKLNSIYELQDRFRAYDRDYFSLDGLEYIEEVLSGDEDELVELDVIGICCEFTEYELPNFISEKDIDFEDLDEDTLLTIFSEMIENNFVLGELRDYGDIDEIIDNIFEYDDDDEIYSSDSSDWNRPIDLSEITNYVDIVSVLSYLYGNLSNVVDKLHDDDLETIVKEYLDNNYYEYKLLDNGNVIILNQ